MIDGGRRIAQFERGAEGLRQTGLQAEGGQQSDAAGVIQHAEAFAQQRAVGVVGVGGQADVGVGDVTAAVGDLADRLDNRLAEVAHAADHLDIRSDQIGGWLGEAGDSGQTEQQQ